MLTHHNHNKYTHIHIYIDSTDLISDYHALLPTFFIPSISCAKFFFSLHNVITFLWQWKNLFFVRDKSPFLEKISQFRKSNHYFLGHKIQSLRLNHHNNGFFAIEFLHKNHGLLTILFEILIGIFCGFTLFCLKFDCFWSNSWYLPNVFVKI